MTQINFKFNHPKYSDEDLNLSISRILNENILCSIASIKENESYIHTAYYCFNKKLNFFFLSDPATQHVQNIEKNLSVAIAIYDSKQSWDNNKCGLQVFGSCEIAKGTNLIEGTLLYLKRFAGLKQWIKHPDDFINGAINSKMFLITPSWIKLFDEKTFGEEVFISLKL